MKIIRVKWNKSPRLKNKGYEILVYENVRNRYDEIPHSRYFLLKNGKQIDGFDDNSKILKQNNIIILLERNKLPLGDLNNGKIVVFVK